MGNAPNKSPSGLNTSRKLSTAADSQNSPASSVTPERSWPEAATLPATTFEGFSSPRPPRLTPKRPLAVEPSKGVEITITYPSSPESLDLGLFERSTTPDMDKKPSHEKTPKKNDLDL